MCLQELQNIVSSRTEGTKRSLLDSFKSAKEAAAKTAAPATRAAKEVTKSVESTAKEATKTVESTAKEAAKSVEGATKGLQQLSPSGLQQSAAKTAAAAPAAAAAAGQPLATRGGSHVAASACLSAACMRAQCPLLTYGVRQSAQPCPPSSVTPHRSRVRYLSVGMLGVAAPLERALRACTNNAGAGNGGLLAGAVAALLAAVGVASRGGKGAKSAAKELKRPGKVAARVQVWAHPRVPQVSQLAAQARSRHRGPCCCVLLPVCCPER